MKAFNVTRKDDCIRIEDLRRTADSVTYVTPEQAVELAGSLSEVVIVELSGLAVKK